MYSEIFNLHSRLLKAISNPKRLEIIHLLRSQELSVGQMQQMLGLHQANLSQHLQLLREHDVVSSRRRGKEIYYRLTHPNFIKSCDAIREVLIERHRSSAYLADLNNSLSDLLPTAVDPVCGMRLTPKTAAYTSVYQNHTYYFCARGCQHAFNKHPDTFINQSKKDYA